jgi:rhamnogalacturonyl hydrolase YesR
MRGEYGNYTDYRTAILLDHGGEVELSREVAGPESCCIAGVMKRVFRWERERLAEESSPDAGWIQAVFMAGVVAAWEVTGDEEYLDTARDWAESNEWKPGPRPRHADDHCSTQTYLALLTAVDGDMSPTLDTFDAMLADPAPGSVEWSWCDALFMAPPAMAALSEVAGDARYLDLALDMWWDTHELLYDTGDRLYYRDSRARSRRDGSTPLTMRGNKLFWSRGNGWVLAGLARVLSHMPEGHSARGDMERLFMSMAGRLAELQPDGGLWPSALLDPPESQPQEASGTALYCYAMAWGVNSGLLDPEVYVPVVERAWGGLVASVDSAGRLGRVQGVGAGPALTEYGHSAPYGSGAMLMAGSEMLRLEASRRER